MILTPRMRWTTLWSMTGEIKSSFRCSELRDMGTAQGEENSVRVEGSVGWLGGKLLLAEASFLLGVGQVCRGSAHVLGEVVAQGQCQRPGEERHSRPYLLGVGSLE